MVGLCVVAGYDVPWCDDEKYDGSDFEAWWLDANGYKTLHDKDKLTDDEWDERFAHKKEFEEKHPCPVMIWPCGEELHLIFAAACFVHTDWDYPPPQAVGMTEMIAAEPDGAKVLNEFCEKFGVELKEDMKTPSWRLACDYR